VAPRKRGRRLRDYQHGEQDGSETSPPQQEDDDSPTPQQSKKKKKKKKKERKEHDADSMTSASEQVEAFNQKFELLTQLLNTMTGEMKHLRKTNDMLCSELQKTQAQLKNTDTVVADLLRSHHRKKEKDLKKMEKKMEMELRRDMAVLERMPGHDIRASSAAPSSSSPMSSPTLVSATPRSSFSFELSLLQSGVSPAVVLESRQQLPWLCHYDVSPSRFAIVDFRCVIMIVSSSSSSCNRSELSRAAIRSTFAKSCLVSKCPPSSRMSTPRSCVSASTLGYLIVIFLDLAAPQF
jgi:hypothetical protein